MQHQNIAVRGGHVVHFTSKALVSDDVELAKEFNGEREREKETD